METSVDDRRRLLRGLGGFWLRFAVVCLLFLGVAQAASAACTSPQTATIAPGGTATFSCSDFGFVSPPDQPPAHGTLDYSQDPLLIYRNTGGAGTVDTFVVQDDNSTPITFRVTITGGGAPTAGPVSATVPYNSSANPITLNTTGSPTSVAVATAAAHGTATASGTAITYTPVTGYAGTDVFTYTATNGAGTSSPATVTVTVSPPTITYAPANPANATVGAPYNGSVAGASGGAAPYTYTVTGGALPAGVTLAPSGSLTGTPTAGGTFSFQAKATDSSTGTGPFASAPHTFTLTVAAPTLAIVPTTLPGGTVGSAYSAAVTASGGTAPYTFSLTGTLPLGVTLSSGGVLSGTPTTPGTFAFTIRATDSSTGTGPYMQTRSYTVTVSGPTITVAPPSVPNATVRSAYSTTFTASGGTAPYTFTNTGALPSGLTLANNGTLSGTPTASGTFNFTVTATDNGGFTGARPYTLTVAATKPLAPTIGAATAGASGSNAAAVTFTAPSDNGGSPITSYTATSTPGGLTATGSASPLTVTGLIAGTPYTFTVRATNAQGDSPESAASNSVGTQATQSITFNNPGAQNYGTAPTLTASSSSGLSVVFSSETTGICTITTGGALTFVSAGSCSIDANQPGNATFAAATQVQQTFTVNAVVPGAPTIGTATAGNQQASVSFSAPASAGGATITQYEVTSSPGGLTATATTSPATITGLTNGTAYTFTVRARNSAGFGSSSADSNAVTPSAGQTITFTNPGTQNYGTTPTLTATASSGLPVAFSSESTGVCTVTSGGALTFVSAGTCTVDANQAGNAAFGPAPQVQQSFTVAAIAPGAPTIGSATAGDQQATVSFTAPATTGGSAITQYTVTSSPGGLTGTGSGSPVTVTGLTNGTAYIFTVTATNGSGTGSASAASNAVTPEGNQTITFTNPGNQNFGTSPTLTATASSGLPVSFTSATTNVCTITSGGLLTTLAPGACTIHADQAGNGAFHPAAQVSQSFNIVVPGGAVSFATPNPLPTATGGVAYSVTIVANGGAAPYAFAMTGGVLPPGVTFSPSGTLSGTPVAAGTYNVTLRVTDAAAQTADKNYQLVVNAPGIAIAPGTLPQGKVATAYPSTTLAASGGTAPYTYAIIAGSLPAGLTLSPAGAVSGTPTAAGSFPVTITATDRNGFQASQAYTVAVDQATPVIVNSTASVPANGSVTVPMTSQGGPVTSATVSQAPAHGNAAVNGLNIVYTPAHDYFGTDTFQYTATGPGGTSAPATATITVTPGAVPTVSAQAATLLAGKAVTIHAAANATNGPFTAAAVVTPPTSGTAVVQGTDIVYTASADASGTLGFDYTVSNAFGASQPAHVTLTVNPLPVAPALTGTVVAGSSVQVNLTALAHGGPFTGAKLVSVSPANAGAASIQPSADGYLLSFTAAPAFGGSAQVMFTLSNAYAESAPGTVTIVVTPRSDPSKDPEVLGVLDAQAEAARRMATGQISNFQRRLETLHSGGGASGFSNGLTVASASNTRQLNGMNGPGGLSGLNELGRTDATGNARFLVQPDASPAPAAQGTPAGGSLPGDVSVWTGGAINFGKMQAGSSDNGIDFTTSGVSMGIDRAFGSNFAAGLGVGYGHDRSDVGQHDSRSSVDAYNAVLYGSYHPADSVYVDGLLGYQWLDYDARRYVTDNGNTVHGNRDGKQWFGSLSVGYQHQAQGMLLTPYGRLDVARAQLEGYTESGDDVYALAYRGQTVKTATGTLGLLVQWTAKRDYGTWSPQLRAEFGHDMQGSSRATMRYADTLSGPLYQATLMDQSRNHTMLGVGVALQTLKGWLLRMEYQNYLDNTSKDNQSILLGVEKKF
ncbi:autotransporter domain-containing protein [Bacillus sp. NP157]|nr:autotransporter domain-containing protein [Bacillus sp. NP157]